MRAFEASGIPERYNLLVRHSSRARSVQLVASPERGIILVLPKRLPPQRVLEAFLRSRQQWIIYQQDRIARLAEKHRAASRIFEGTSVLLEGEHVRIHFAQTQAKRISVEYNTTQQELVIAIPRTLNTATTSEQAQIRRALKRWYIQKATVALKADSEAGARQQGVTYGRVAVKEMRTLWGSCAADGRLSFNWRLILVASAVRRSIVHHELTHRVWRNHGIRFWNRLTTFDPQARKHARWLAKEGPVLMAFLCEERV